MINYELQDILQTMERVNYEIVELTHIKHELEIRIKKNLNHPDNASKTYTEQNYKVTVTTGFNYALDKARYEELKGFLPDVINPVKVSTKYELDKKTICEAEKFGSSEDLSLLSQIINKKPKKIHVKIVKATQGEE